MIILGISCEHDSGAAVIEDGRVLAAANEERFCRTKLVTTFPRDSIASVLKITGIRPADIDLVSLSSAIHMPESAWDWDKRGNWTSVLVETISKCGMGRLFGWPLGVKGMVSAYRIGASPWRLVTVKRALKELGVVSKISVIDHHEGHAYSAFGTSGWEDCLVITLDGQGDGLCSRAMIGESGTLRPLHSVPFYHSPCYYYACVTKLLGFKYGREGKVTGLAAYGDPEKTIQVFRDTIQFRPASTSFWSEKRGYQATEIESLGRLLSTNSPEDIAAGVQKQFEDLVVAYIGRVFQRFGIGEKKLALAGGAFANVKLNQKIAEMHEVQEVFIHPHMGDGGLAVGSALALWARCSRALGKTWRPQRLDHVYLGPEYSDDEIAAAIREEGLEPASCGNVEAEIASRLAEGKVVARFCGRMEYGPRALGNRSILCQAIDPATNVHLNAQLDRTEFMPFAPAVRKERLSEFFQDAEKCRHALEFMTITLNVTEKCRGEAPAIVHVDGTARPQVVSEDTHPSYYKILKKYEDLTGRGILINTSFNIHEEPIVNTPQDALRVFRQGRLDCLAIGNYILDDSPESSVATHGHASRGKGS